MTQILSMRFPTATLILIIIVIWLGYELKKNSYSGSSLLQQEQKANQTRKKPLDDLHYITIPLDSLPFFSGIDEKLEDIQNQIQSLAGQTIVNLNAFTNTELKLQYGVANLPSLTEYDQNFLLLSRLLFQWGNQLYELSYPQEAISVLEYGISLGTDMKGIYQLLTKLYRENGLEDRIPKLMTAAHALPESIMKQGILSELNA